MSNAAPGEGLFPDAAFLVLSSRLIPGLDGGYTIAAVARARQLAARGVDVQLLTVDPGSADAHAEHRAAFQQLGMLPADVPLRNLFDEGSASSGGAAEWLCAAADAGAPVLDAGVPATVPQREIRDAEGRLFLTLPVISGDPDWHLSTASVRVFDEHGDQVGALPGFGGLYRAWLDHVVDGLDRPVVLICESRQLGELLAGWSHPQVRILHPVHTMHLEEPYTPDAALNPLWARWLALRDRFDAVLWPTHAQCDDVRTRFGGAARDLVAPNGIALPAVDDSAREPGLVVSMSRLAPGKRIDQLVRAFLAADVPGSRLDIWGDGPSHASLAELVSALDAGDRVQLKGRTDQPEEVLRRATLMVTSTAYEGQGLSIVEAMAAGCPVISYDVPYGPGDALRHGGGMLVPSGDEQALSDAIRTVLTDETLRATLAAQAPEIASAWSEDAAMVALADAAQQAVAGAPRR